MCTRGIWPYTFIVRDETIQYMYLNIQRSLVLCLSVSPSLCLSPTLYQFLSRSLASLMKISPKPIETEMAAGNVQQIRVHLSVSRFSENPERPSAPHNIHYIIVHRRARNAIIAYTAVAVVSETCTSLSPPYRWFAYAIEHNAHTAYNI